MAFVLRVAAFHGVRSHSLFTNAAFSLCEIKIAGAVRYGITRYPDSRRNGNADGSNIPTKHVRRGVATRSSLASGSAEWNLSEVEATGDSPWSVAGDEGSRESLSQSPLLQAESILFIGKVCPARRNVYSEELEAAGIATYQCAPNRAAEFLAVLDAVQPTIAVFDRFTTEEAFSFRLRERCPDCLLVLDTQDLHFLRANRQRVVSEGGSIVDALHHVPDTSSRELLRELAAMHRCDLTLLCSEAELSLLTRCYAFPPHKLALASFFYDTDATYPSSTASSPRHHFTTVGTFRHAPNVDAVSWLATHIWPAIRAQLPMAECHVYGSYTTAAISSLNDPSSGFLIRGHAPSLHVLASYRVLLAPLRFGAGIKGKILDSWLYGTPVVTTPIGGEGMGGRGGGEGGKAEGEEVNGEAGGVGGWSGGQQWGGLCGAEDAESFVADAVRLYCDQQLWATCQSAGRAILHQQFGMPRNGPALLASLAAAKSNMGDHRLRDYTAAILWHDSNRATEYFSRWIELKERGGRPPL
ncbi:hypothetical protein CLOP_g25747 [Closterium sp. NIES-67]|nr:hypothetical protein CLOP_g25747 [Closterium sp. NIES-67]